MCSNVVITWNVLRAAAEVTQNILQIIYRLNILS